MLLSLVTAMATSRYSFIAVSPLDTAAGLALWLLLSHALYVIHRPYQCAFTAILVCLHANHANLSEAMQHAQGSALFGEHGKCVQREVSNFVMLQLSKIDIRSLGPQFETHSVFPKKTNTHFVQILGRDHVKVSVWERGAGQTLACGTGACAIVVAGVLEGKTDRKCQVDLPGGPLVIEWRESDNHIYMTGPAELAFRGVAEV